MREATSGKYVGLPMVIGGTKNQVFGYVKSNINSKLQCWRNRLLSLAGKDILMKSILMALPNYTMYCFKLPKGLCKEIHRKIASF